MMPRQRRTEKHRRELTIALEKKVFAAVAGEEDRGIVISALCLMLAKMIYLLRRDGNPDAMQKVFQLIGAMEGDLVDDRDSQGGKGGKP